MCKDSLKKQLLCEIGCLALPVCDFFVVSFNAGVPNYLQMFKLYKLGLFLGIAVATCLTDSISMLPWQIAGILKLELYG